MRWNDYSKKNIWIEINSQNFLNNIKVARSQLEEKVQLMAMVKGDGYGHGVESIIPLLNSSDIDRVGVYRTEEAVELLRLGMNKPIQQLTFSSYVEMKEMLLKGITPTISTIEQVDHLLSIEAEYDHQLVIHVRVDVSNSGIGLSSNEATSAIETLSKKKNIIIEGVFTHLPSTYLGDPRLIAKEKDEFEKIKENINQLPIKKPMFHAGSSPSLYRNDNIHYDMVRVGTMIYGLPSIENVKIEELKPVMSLKSKIIAIKQITEGISSGYTSSLEHSELRKIATVPIGYADAHFLFHYHHGDVLVEGQRTSMFGETNMSHMLIDITDNKKAKIDSEVVIIGKQQDEKITFEEIAKKIGWGTVHCEFIGLVSSAIPRIVVKQQKSVVCE